MSPSENPSSSEWEARGSFFFVEWVFSVFEISIFLFSSQLFYGINELDNYFMVFVASYAAVMYTTHWACISNLKPIRWNYLNGCSLHIMHMLFVVVSPLSFSWEDGGHSSCFILIIHCIRKCVVIDLQFIYWWHYSFYHPLRTGWDGLIVCLLLVLWMLWYWGRAVISA